MVEQCEEMKNVQNFGAYAIVVDNQFVKSLKKEYETITKRLQAQIQNVKFICLKNDEVRLLNHTY